MPVKWTPENDQLLLLKILETHELSVDTKKVAAAWPGIDGQDRPTPRAIAERLVRMRQIVKSNNGTSNSNGHFSIGRGTGSNSANSTPRKSRKANTTTTPNSSKRKRGAAAAGVAGDRDGDETPETAAALPFSTSFLTSLSSPVKMEMDEDEDEKVRMTTPTPTKKSLRPALATAMNQGNNGYSYGYSYGQDSGNGKPISVGSTLSLDVKEEGEKVTPMKRTRRASVLPPGMVSYAAGDNEDDSEKVDDVESSASEYVPDEAAVRMENDIDTEYA